MRYKNILHTFCVAASLMALSWGVSSCRSIVEDIDGILPDNMSSMAIQPHIFRGTVSRAVGDEVPGVDALKENDLLNLDVFVFGADTDNSSFRKVYHLTSTADNIASEVESLLSEYWPHDGFVAGKKYDVYVAANNDATASLDPAALTSTDVLKSLKVNEWSTDCVWDDGTINPAALNLHKLYSASAAANDRAFTSSKSFVMDGVVKGWTPDATKAKQVIEVDMNRAASKFIVNVEFDPDFLKSLTHIKNSDDTWTEKEDSKKITIDGQPGWRFLNFAYDAPVFDHVTAFGATAAPKPEHILNSGALILGTANYSTVEGENKKFTITTYSYPNSWESTNAMNDAPAIALSVGYKTGDNKPVYNYYRIPIVNQTTTTEIGRNKIYIVNAKIAAQGSTLLDEMEDIRVDYDVVDWIDPSMSGVDPSEVYNIDNVFLQVTPHTYTLRGDGSQSVDLTYFLPSGYHIGIQYFTSKDYNETVARGINPGNVGVTQTIGTDGVVTRSDAAEPAWYYNLNSDYMTTFQYYTGTTNPDNPSANNLTGLTSGDVQLSVKDNNSTGTISKGTITVSSTAMYNKAVKYIVMRVYLAKDVDGAAVDDWYGKKLYRDIYIKHFPTDNVQSVEGWWSTKTSTTTTRVYSYDPVADGWESYDGVEEREIFENTDLANRSETLTDGSPTDNDGYVSGPSAYNGYLSDRLTSTQAQQANSEANAQRSNDGFWYWGSGNVTQIGWFDEWNDYDYSIGSGLRQSRYRYQNRYRAQYYKTHYYRNVYYRDVEVVSDGGWVDWKNDPKTEGTAVSATKYTYDGSNFAAKVYYNGLVYPITVSRTGQQGNRRYYYTRGGSQNDYFRMNTPTNTYDQVGLNMTGLNNNHMYVIQISRTSDTYVLGRPELDNNKQSQDQVASPAFMIASQLGAVSTFGTGDANARRAATHCGSYMEVTQDDVRYTGWRLPTDEEVQVIINYQGNANGVVKFKDENGNDIYVRGDYRSMASVLTGAYYHSLDGTPASTGYSGTDVAVRCVRDLSAAEIEAINNQVENSGN